MPAGAQGRDPYERNRQLSSVQTEIRKYKEALKQGIPDPRARTREVERLEVLSRDAENLEARDQRPAGQLSAVDGLTAQGL